MKTNNSDKKLRRFNEIFNHAVKQHETGSHENAALSFLKAARLLNQHEYPDNVIKCLLGAGYGYLLLLDVIKEKAEKSLLEALHLNEKVYDKNNAWTSFISTLLTLLYHKTRDDEKSKLYAEKALDTNKGDFQNSISSVMTFVCFTKGEFDKAERYCKDTVEIKKSTLGENHSDTIEASKILEIISQYKSLEEENKKNRAALHQANRLAYLGQMATMMAHNINNPVGIIRMKATGAMQDIQEGLFDTNTELQPLLSSIIEQTERLNTLINNFRQFARGDRNTLSATPLNSLINDIYALLFAAPYQMDKIELQKDFIEPTPIAYSNEFALQEILISLLSNARAALKDKDNKVVLIRTWQENNQVGFDIEDSGEGILEEQRDKLFTPFLSSKHEGMGLGLYFCKEICKDLDGNIEYYPAPQGGAGFRITLPIEQDSEHGTQI
ncbi:two-component system, LuxR family, sensor kinase FixL [Patescibacteria group bacterium]|nr:two-component system, LuxR family, sensor kinase FixL [Patescibacteria group bacterium]